MKLILSLACTLCLLFSQSELPSRYHTYDEIVDSLFHWNSLFADNNTPSQYYPGSGIIYQMEEIGQTGIDDLPIYAVKLSYNADIVDLNLEEKKIRQSKKHLKQYYPLFCYLFGLA